VSDCTLNSRYHFVRFIFLHDTSFLVRLLRLGFATIYYLQINQGLIHNLLLLG
jgi:hypothetical protein